MERLLLRFSFCLLLVISDECSYLIDKLVLEIVEVLVLQQLLSRHSLGCIQSQAVFSEWNGWLACNALKFVLKRISVVVVAFPDRQLDRSE